MNLFSQTIGFSYDASGNRVSRTLVVQQLQASSDSLPSINAKSLNSVENVKSSETADVKQDSIKSENGEITPRVYPNPTKGLIEINISNMPFNPTNEMRLYDITGSEMTMKRNFDSKSEIDLTQYKNGIYILRIKINGKTFDWKVIKNQ
jgi:hypothetical protein